MKCNHCGREQETATAAEILSQGQYAIMGLPPHLKGLSEDEFVKRVQELMEASMREAWKRLNNPMPVEQGNQPKE